MISFVQFPVIDSGNAVLREIFTHTHPKKNWTRNVVKKPNKNFPNGTINIQIKSNRHMECTPNKLKHKTLSKAE
jgi:hypothetical protein